MATAADFPVTFPYAATTSPYSTANPHKGEDRAMAVGTPVIVNGVCIGYSGNTGDSTGPHLHIGRFISGLPTPPNGRGFGFAETATVTQIGEDATNGRFVRLGAEGSSWVYLHLSNVSCSLGQILPAITGGKGADVITNGVKYMNEDGAKDLWRLGLHREPENDQVWRSWVGHPFNEGSDTFRNSQEWLNQNHVLLVAYPAAVKALDDVRRQLVDLQNKPPQVIESIKTINQCVIDTSTMPADDASMFVKFVAWLTGLIGKKS
jgi:hypothetical protein